MQSKKTKKVLQRRTTRRTR